MFSEPILEMRPINFAGKRIVENGERTYFWNISLSRSYQSKQAEDIQIDNKRCVSEKINFIKVS